MHATGHSVVCQNEGPGLRPISRCFCYGDVVTYECTVCVDFATVWEGTAFQCASGEIILTHQQFGTAASSGVCGQIVGRGLFGQNRCYTSRVNVTFDRSLEGESVICSDEDGRQSREVGSLLLQASRGNAT